MDNKELGRLSCYIISEYYRNNLVPFFEHLDENVEWYGPAEGQFITTKQAMLESWKKEKHSLKFAMSDLKDRVITINKNAASVILSYYVSTLYPDGTKHTHNQRVDLTWVKKHGHPFIVKIFIANLHSRHQKDNIYAIHGQNQKIGQLDILSDKRIIVKNKIGTTYHLVLDNIIWIEKSDEGRHSIIHATHETIDSLASTSSILKQSEDYFLSPHISYLINPLYVDKIERFKLTLKNGKTIPIAEKKYTKFKKQLHAAQGLL